MPNIHDSGCDTFTVTESRVWRIIRDCIRKETPGKKQQQIENFKLGDMACTISDTKTDHLKTDRKDLQILQTKKSLGCRKSWTYGFGARNNCDKRTDSEDEDHELCDNSGDRVVSENLRRVKELQREHSFPGKMTGSHGSLTKTEARRRLMSWKKTTIARKNSEKQIQEQH